MGGRRRHPRANQPGSSGEVTRKKPAKVKGFEKAFGGGVIFNNTDHE